MKKMWKKNNKAVSPVIATILMVAITVVLAAVLYVMVMGFGGESSQNPTAAVTATSTTTAHTEKVLVASISEISAYSNYKISVIIGGVAHVASTIAPGALTLAPVNASYTITFVDIAADSKLGTGDYFLITSTAGGATMVLNLLWGSDSESIASDSWNQP